MNYLPPPPIPYHHTRYARAWSLYRGEDLSEEARLSLEKEMDSAQNHFTFAEFQTFKITLPGYQAYWDDLAEKAKEAIQA